MRSSSVRGSRRALLVAALALGAWAASPAPADGRAGGGCLERGTRVLTARGPVSVESLKPGDRVVSVLGRALVEAEVEAVTSVEPQEYVELGVAGQTLRLTGEHPVEIGPGVFRMANALHAGDAVRIRNGSGTAEAVITSVRRLGAVLPAYNLMVLPVGTYVANSVVVHNKGCFLPETLIRREDGSEVPISHVRAGDRVLAFTPDGTVVGAAVIDVVTREVGEYRIVRTASIELRVTAEHPFYVGNATFKTLESLSVGDTIYAYDGKGLSPQPIESIEAVAEAVLVYNLQTDRPNTFFANGVAVHNKGGSCFARGTRIRTPEGEVPIEQVRLGDRITAIDEEGRSVVVAVTGTHATRSPLVVIETPDGSLRTTGEHPIGVGSGEFIEAGRLGAGGTVLMWLNGRAISVGIRSRTETAAVEEVFNLTVGSPHTFVADGFLVHNKGGGSHGGSHIGGHGSSRSISHGIGHSGMPVPGATPGPDGWTGAPEPAQTSSWVAPVATAGAVFAAIAIGMARKSRRANLDFVFSDAAVAKKRDTTVKLLEFIAKQDAAMNPETLRKQAESTFLKLQECWQARDLSPMKPLLMADLYGQQDSEVQGMIRNHEVDVLDGLRVDRIDLVNVRYTVKEDQRAFTALITATACDYYVDDRTRKRLRGDTAPARFQEFWTFQRLGGAWLLREIEQTRESNALKEDNLFEQFTDAGVRGIVGKDAEAQGPKGAGLEEPAATKDTRIERLLGFLVQTDKMWDRQLMLESTRKVFLGMAAAWESGNASDIPSDALFPDVAKGLADQLASNRSQGVTLEFRNLCVRKTELVLVRNFVDNTKDEFVARVRAHAQRFRLQNGRTVYQDEDVTPFDQYLVMGRSDNRWKLKETLSAQAGEAALKSENLDEGSTPGQLEWFYQHKRPT